MARSRFYDRSQNQERAIGAFGNTLSVRTREADAERWAATRLNLGIAFWERLAGDQAQNREQAIGAFEDALSVWARDVNPDGWAAAQAKLGIAYRERLAGNRSENRERAIAAFEKALRVWVGERNPEEAPLRARTAMQPIETALPSGWRIASV
jgi:hypothetical protein